MIKLDSIINPRRATLDEVLAKQDLMEKICQDLMHRAAMLPLLSEDRKKIYRIWEDYSILRYELDWLGMEIMSELAVDSEVVQDDC